MVELMIRQWHRLTTKLVESRRVDDAEFVGDIGFVGFTTDRHRFDDEGNIAASCRAVGSEDVSLKITHCGVCYSDVIYSKNKHGDSMYPVVPGDCEECNEGLEVYCSKKIVLTFNSIDEDDTVTKGGYSSFILVHQRYCFKIPDNYPLASAASLLCAGISVYTPMMHHKMNKPGKRLGVVVLGGLGHMAVLFGKAFGLHVTVFSTSASKKEEALNLLGADNFVLSNYEHQMKVENYKQKPHRKLSIDRPIYSNDHGLCIYAGLDKIIGLHCGLSIRDHSFDQYLSLLKAKGVLALVGYPNKIKITPHPLLSGT
ncbi:hypothetical protein Ddye_019083 [Dipteronia dyeriana]|uniref:Alcohol dehydrogenase n=1 Tax=Dipteronia dyeriana TaxID=168575 RepID=A0AAD9TXQ6_9ROSI|nr:hypothetical protein Ddye_019083 [Dipteronia dyeriana]